MRKRYRYVPELDAVVDVQELAVAKQIQSIFFLPDLNTTYNGGFVSPIDDTFISSRSQLREHNKRHGVEQNGDIRGEAGRQMTKKFMDWDPSLVRSSDSFNWSNPTSNSKSSQNDGYSKSSGNLTEI